MPHPKKIKACGGCVPREWMSMADLSAYCGLSPRTLRDLLRHPVNPLPHVRLNQKILRVRRADFDAWMERFRFDGDSQVDQIVSEVMGTL